MAYDAWTEGYLKAKQSKANKFDPKISIRFERVGNWNTIKQSRLLDLRKHLIMLSKE